MDPDELLSRMRLALHKFNNPSYIEDIQESAEDIARDFDDLDEWLTQGGFLPQAWEHRATASA